MFQAPTAVWNQIADAAPLQTEFAQRVFPLPEDLMDAEVEAQEQRVAQETGDPMLAAPYLLTMPLLWEADAIRTFKAQGGPGNSLPMVESVQQAVALASREYRLTTAQQRQLATLLQSPPM